MGKTIIKKNEYNKIMRELCIKYAKGNKDLKNIFEKLAKCYELSTPEEIKNTVNSYSTEETKENTLYFLGLSILLLSCFCIFFIPMISGLQTLEQSRNDSFEKNLYSRVVSFLWEYKLLVAMIVTYELYTYGRDLVFPSLANLLVEYEKIVKREEQDEKIENNLKIVEKNKNNNKKEEEKVVLVTSKFFDNIKKRPYLAQIKEGTSYRKTYGKKELRGLDNEKNKKLQSIQPDKAISLLYTAAINGFTKEEIKALFDFLSKQKNIWKTPLFKDFGKKNSFSLSM